MSGWLGDIRRLWRNTIDDIKEQAQGPGPNMYLDREPLLARCDRSRPAADVKLDPGAQQRIMPTGNVSSIPDLSEIFVLLAEDEGNDGRCIAVYIGEERVGTLTAADSADFWLILAAAKAQDKPLVGEAIRDRDAGGAWALHVYKPEPT